MLRFVFFTLKTYLRAHNPRSLVPTSDCHAAVDVRRPESDHTAIGI